MARNRIGLNFDGWEDYMAKLDEIGGSDTMKRGVESALKASKQHVKPLIYKSIQSSSLPAKGIFSHGSVRQSVDNDMNVEWSAMTGHIKVGFDFYKGGLTSVFLMYGTPRMKPAKGLKAAIYGAKTKKEIAQIQAEAISKVMKRIMEG